jgi:cobalt transporter subunit CbtB
MATVNASVHSSQTSAGATTASKLVAIACVGLFGLGLVWAAGFANAEALHNAAHDSRHSLAFPCH